MNFSFPEPEKIKNLDIDGDLFPPIIKKLIEEFNYINKEGIERQPFANRFILYGSHGSGKTSIVKYFAQETDSHYIQLNGPTLWNTYENSSATTIKELFDFTLSLARDFSKSIIILIDDVDKIAPIHVQDGLKLTIDHIITQLCQGLDAISGYGNIALFLTTNNLEKITSSGLLDRFESDHIICIPGLPNDKRKEYLRTLFITMQMPHVRLDSLDGLNYIAKLVSIDPSGGGKSLCKHVENIYQACLTLKAEFNNYILNNQSSITQTRIDILLEPLQDFYDALDYAIHHSNNIAQNKTNGSFIAKYAYLVRQYIARIREYPTKKHFVPSSELLDSLTRLTKGFSIRHISELVYSVFHDAQIDHNGIVTENLILEKINQIKAKIKHIEKCDK